MSDVFRKARKREAHDQIKHELNHAGDRPPGQQVFQRVAVRDNVGDGQGESRERARETDGSRHVAFPDERDFIVRGDFHVNQKKREKQRH